MPPGRWSLRPATRSSPAAASAIRGGRPTARIRCELRYAAGGAHASVGGSGELRVALDGGALHAIEVPAPGLYELTEHPRHEPHRLELSASPGIELYSVSFSAGLP